jgi:murein DD-endopeptidase MepM/ murein hydrolase activator NlpD
MTDRDHDVRRHRARSTPVPRRLLARRLLPRRGRPGRHRAAPPPTDSRLRTISGRRVAVGLTLAVAVLVSAVVVGVSALVHPGLDRAPAINLAGLAARQNAAHRADRGSRLAPGSAALLPGNPTAPTPSPTPAPKPAWVSPLPGATITSCFGPRWGAQHQGIDFAMPEGTPIRAAADGTVLGAGWLYSGYGMSVMIDNGGGIFTHYAHADQVLVTAGQKVIPGQVIALEGATGDATGPHLHFEVHAGLWNQIDPAPFLRARGVAIAGC